MELVKLKDMLPVVGEKIKTIAWQVIAYLPEHLLWNECAVCLFWRGAAVGALMTGLLAWWLL